MKVSTLLSIILVGITFTYQAHAAAFTGAAASVGTSGAGGGNTVGDELFDDYENQGSRQVSAEEIARLAAPVLKDLDSKVPEFANRLRQGIKGIIWYREPKLLNQSGICRNGSDTGLTPPINQVVRACQNNLDVRIEQAWYDKNMKSNPSLVSGLVVHELLVFQRIRSAAISEEAVLRISRDIRSRKLTEAVLQDELKVAGFGSFQTFTQAKIQQQEDHLAAISDLHDAYDKAISLHTVNCENQSILDRTTKWAETHASSIEDQGNIANIQSLIGLQTEEETGNSAVLDRDSHSDDRELAKEATPLHAKYLEFAQHCPKSAD